MSDPTLSAPSSRRISRHSGQPSVQHPSRIEKPRSHHSSPRLLERRKTTTETKLYATLDDHFRMMFGMSPEDAPQERPQPSRPVSWHPSSSQLQASRPAAYFEPVPQHSSWPEQPSPSRQSNYSSDFFSLSTRNSMYGSMANVPNYTTALNTPVSEPLPWYLQQWAQKNQAQVMLDPHVRSPEWLPIQGHAEQEEAAEEDAGEGLVALGLYDVPEPSPIWDTTLEGTGKGLKLEETWQPPAQDDDGVAEEDGEEDSSEASVEEPSPPLPPTNALCPYPYMQMPVHGKSQPSGSMQGPSVFLGGDESVSNEWWFQSLQPVTMPVRDRGLGYGWL